MRPRKYTQETIIAKCKEIHGNKYDYSKVVYKGIMEDVIVVCPIHGDFTTTMNTHTSGKGCWNCAVIYRGKNHRLTQKEFIDKCEDHFQDRYDLSEALYDTQYVKVKVGCSVHGEFWRKPSELMQGQGCQKCGRLNSGVVKRKSSEEFIEEMKILHNNLYDYSMTEYVRLLDKIKVGCPTHGIFEIQAGNHSMKRGCPYCAKNGYKVNKPASIYVLTDGIVTKIGITGRKVPERCKKISNSSNKSFIIFNEFHFDEGRTPLKIEGVLLKEFLTSYSQPTEVFDGSTECFYNLDPNHAVQRIQELSANLTESPSHDIIL